MTIAINARFLTQPLTGVQRYASELVSALDKRLAQDPALAAEWGGIRAYVPAGKPFSRPDWQHIPVHALPGAQGHLWEQTALWRATRDGVLLSLGNSGPLWHQRHVLALHDSHIYDIPQAFTTSYRYLHRYLRPRLARRARRLLTVSPHSARRLGHHLNLRPDAFTVVPNSAEHILRAPRDPDVLARLDLTPQNFLLSVGTQSPNKNIEALIAAHAQAGHGMPKLVIVGSSGAGLVAQELAVGSQVCFAGRVTEATLRTLYENARGFVFPSLNEGFGLPPLEAMSLGTPVLAARRAALPETLGEAALWFDPGLQGHLVSGLQALVGMPPDQRAKRTKAGRTQAAGFNWNRSVDVLVSALRQARGMTPGMIAPPPLQSDFQTG